MFLVEDAMILSINGHRGQTDDGGQPYIHHPEHVSGELIRLGHRGEVLMLAWMHDLLEDTDLTISVLRDAGCPESVITSLQYMTHIKDEAYIEDRFLYWYGQLNDRERAKYLAKEDEYLYKYIPTIAQNDMARIVKIEDLRHNSMLSRLPACRFSEPQIGNRIMKYAKALSMLTGGKVGAF
jgi:(p)ppGpp synthase/HD superfamily hydrolase